MLATPNVFISLQSFRTFRRTQGTYETLHDSFGYLMFISFYGLWNLKKHFQICLLLSQGKCDSNPNPNPNGIFLVQKGFYFNVSLKGRANQK